MRVSPREMRSGVAPQRCCIKEESSFLKKRSKRLLYVRYGVRCSHMLQAPRNKSLFASFSLEKEDSSWVIFLNVALMGRSPGLYE